MKQFSVAVDKIEDGILHVRSAGLIMKEASQFASDVKVTKDEKTVNGKDILEWMGLKLAVGDVITVNIEGPDEEATADSFEVFPEPSVFIISSTKCQQFIMSCFFVAQERAAHSFLYFSALFLYVIIA